MADVFALILSVPAFRLAKGSQLEIRSCQYLLENSPTIPDKVVAKPSGQCAYGLGTTLHA